MSESTTILIISILQLVLALGLINVWLLRFKKSTKYRGGEAKNMKDEFAVYGLPSSFMYVVGFLKLSIAFIFITGLFSPVFNLFVSPSAKILALLMVGAILMHIKVKDKFIKTLPALLMLLMSSVLVYLI